MAYRFLEADIVADPRRAREAVQSAPSADFGPLEASAVWIGMHDPPSTLQRSRLARWLHDRFGLFPNPLSDARLEAIRRLTVALRHRLAEAGDEAETAREAGVSEAQIAALEARFGAGAAAA